MGQENSHLVNDDTPPKTLSDRSIGAVADLMRNRQVKRIVVMTGAGISTAAGIPDFRSPKTGLYHNLQRLDLPAPEAVFDVGFFRENPRPFYLLAKELYPGNFQPTISHVFISLLAKRKLLRMLFTQNIDCLERRAGVPDDLIVEAHGSFASQRCVYCKHPLPDDEMREFVAQGEPPPCPAKGCDGFVKPDIVFFGEQLPKRFYDEKAVAAMADLVIVLGTSLTVQPFASLPRLAREDTPRLLINKERVGDLGTRADDVLELGDCDAGVRRLADELGWRDELEKMWTELVGEKEVARQKASAKERDEEIEGQVDGVIDGIEKELERLEIKEEASLDEDPHMIVGKDGDEKDTDAPTGSSDPPPDVHAGGPNTAKEDGTERDVEEDISKPPTPLDDRSPRESEARRSPEEIRGEEQEQNSHASRLDVAVASYDTPVQTTTSSTAAGETRRDEPTPPPDTDGRGEEQGIYYAMNAAHEPTNLFQHQPIGHLSGADSSSPMPDIDGQASDYGDMSLDTRRLQARHNTEGYREGVVVGKAQSIQAGFDQGFSRGASIGLEAGRLLGLLESLVAALREGGHPGESARANQLLTDAQHELSTNNIFDIQYCTTDGRWKFLVEGQAYEDAASRHPIIEKWNGIIEEEIRRWTLDVTLPRLAD